ncbi:MAG: carbon-phosphorus lyase complex subunit PhnI [Chloroflexota bacterium]|nr:carbon-phosphorus lyase complex subunit PhnI [Chloroflexota bacterium]
MYVAAKGGEQAIQNAEALYQALNGGITLADVRTIMEKMPYLVDRVMGEGSLYAPELAALAIAQTGGDLYEAVLLLRAYRATQPRIAYANPASADTLLTVRRISAAFKDIPGGQILGPSLDYSHRLLRLDVLDAQEDLNRQDAKNAEDAAHASVNSALSAVQNGVVVSDAPAPPTYPALADWQRGQGLLPQTQPQQIAPADIPDVTTDTVTFPAPRAHRLQALARADTGGVLALGYSIMRGYGLIHPTVNELRLGYAEVELAHPVTGATFSAGRVRVSHCEVITPDAGKNGYMLGFAATMGWNEVKLIASSTLDLDMAANEGDGHSAHSEEFVMYHTEPVESSGFCIHFKLPHYVTFASSLDNVRKIAAASGWEK